MSKAFQSGRLISWMRVGNRRRLPSAACRSSTCKVFAVRFERTLFAGVQPSNSRSVRGYAHSSPSQQVQQARQAVLSCRSLQQAAQVAQRVLVTACDQCTAGTAPVPTVRGSSNSNFLDVAERALKLLESWAKRWRLVYLSQPGSLSCLC